MKPQLNITVGARFKLTPLAGECSDWKAGDIFEIVAIRGPSVYMVKFEDNGRVFYDWYMGTDSTNYYEEMPPRLTEEELASATSLPDASELEKFFNA